MKNSLTERPVRTIRGFKRYVSWFSIYAKEQTRCIETKRYKTEQDLEEYAYLISIIDMEAIFINQLSEKEKQAIDYCRYHNPNEGAPRDYEVYLLSAYNKWHSIFFPSGKTVPDINYKVLGKKMRLLRKESLRTKTELGRILEVDRTAIARYEEGTRKPSLEYIYKFSKVFGCSIDDLIN